MKSAIITVAFLVLLGDQQTVGAADPAESLLQILAKENIRAGLCVRLGNTDGRLEETLVENGLMVHTLTVDTMSVDVAREHLTSKHLYGPASIERITEFTTLPYADNLVNCVIIDDLEDLLSKEGSLTEIKRILAPGGIVAVDCVEDKHVEAKRTALLKGIGLQQLESLSGIPGWLCTVKPRPFGMDQWTHHRHGVDGNRMSKDEMVGVPTGPRWIAGPKFSDQSYRRMLVTNRHLVTLTRNRHESVQYLTVRDAFNGLLLWQRAIRIPEQSTKNVYQQNPQWPLVADKGLLFVCLEKHLAALDIGTGKEIRTFDIGETSTESIHALLYSERMLIAIGMNRLYVFDATTAKELWSTAAQASDVVIGERKIYYSEADRETELFHVVALDLATGKKLWRTHVKDIRAAHIDRRGNLATNKLQIFYQQGYVIAAGSDLQKNGSIIATLSAENGQQLSSFATKLRRVEQIFFRDGLIWVPPSLGIDPKSGQVVKKLTGGGPWGAFSTSTCQSPVCTARFVFSPKPSLRAYEFQSSRVRTTSFTLATCGIGTIPANGLLYNSTQTGCLCSQNAIHGLTALESAEPIVGTSDRLEKGPAFGDMSVASNVESELDWPMFRRDPIRSGTAKAKIDPQLKLLWHSPISTNSEMAEKLAANAEGIVPKNRITPPVIANGKVLVAEIDAHRIFALDAQTGKKCWHYTAGGRIDSPPTIHRGLCLFGSHDGWVYCLRMRDGQLVWRFRAAPTDKRIVAYGQLESCWPVFGSVLVLDDTAYVTAGRSSKSQGGIAAMALNPSTGEVLWKQDVNSGLNDLLVSDGESIYLRNIRLDPKTGRSTTAARLISFKGPGEVRIPGDPERGPPRPSYLYSGWFSTLIDGSWRFAKTTYAKGNQRRTYDGRTFGQVIVFDDRRSFAFQTGYWSGDHLYGGPRYPTQLVAAMNRVATSNLRDNQESTPLWTVPIATDGWIEAMTLVDKVLFVAGPVDRNFRGEKGGFLWAQSTSSGKRLFTANLPSPPVLEGLATARGWLYVSTEDGRVICFTQK